MTRRVISFVSETAHEPEDRVRRDAQRRESLQEHGRRSWAGCLPEDGSVVVVLSNRVVDDIYLMARPLVDAVTAD